MTGNIPRILLADEIVKENVPPEELVTLRVAGETDRLLSGIAVIVPSLLTVTLAF